MRKTTTTRSRELDKERDGWTPRARGTRVTRLDGRIERDAKRLTEAMG